MLRTDPDAPAVHLLSGICRAVCFASWGGIVLGGIVGTIDWPGVATFFGAGYGLVAGALTGVVDGLLLAGLASRRWPVWSMRVASALVVFVAAVVVTRHGAQFTALAQPPGRIAAVLGCVVVGALAGPLIAYGVEPVIWVRRRSAAVRLSRVGSRWLLWGTIAGAVPGGVVGLLLGIQADLATAPFAVVEGAVLGSVSGVVLAALVGALAIAPRLRIRR